MSNELEKVEEEEINIVTERPAPDVSEDDDAEDDRRVAQSSSSVEASVDDDREAIRARRREERHNRKQHNREVRESQERLISSLQIQNRDLSERLAHLESRQASGESASLEQQLNEAVRTAEEAKQHIKNATEAGDGEAVADATELLYAARRRAEHLASLKQRQAQPRQRPEQAQAGNQVAKLASEWAGRNAWYKADGSDRDSMLARQVDSQLAAEGYDPRTKEYWFELEDRLAEVVPHRYNGGSVHKNNNMGKVPVNGGTNRDATAPAKKRDFYLSPERVQAMKDAGMYNDPKLRDMMVRKYMAYDKQQNEDR